MEWLIIGLFVSAVSYFLNQGERAKAKQDSLDIQHDSQEFESAEADKARHYQEDFYLKYQSPEALMSQYRNLGASESASLMSALGVSPSMPSPVKASSSPAGGLGAGVNNMSDLLNSLTGGFNQYMQGQKAGVETEWIAPVNEANIQRTLGELEIKWKEFGLQKDSYFNISKPLAEMSLNKTRQEIEESKARVKEIDQNILNLQQQIKESEQNINESIARTDLYGEQAITEQYKQENIAADTALKGAEKENFEADTALKRSQKTGQDIQNALDGYTLIMCENTGLDVRLQWTQNMAYKADFTIGNMVRVILGGHEDGYQCSWSDFNKAVNKTYDGLLAGIDNRALANKAFASVKDFMKGYHKDSSFKFWYRKHASRFKNAQDWIERNTKYGM